MKDSLGKILNRIQTALDGIATKTIVESLPQFDLVRIHFPYDVLWADTIKIYVYQSKQDLLCICPIQLKQDSSSSVMLKSLMQAYGLTISSANTLTDATSRSLAKRITALIQGAIAIDALARGMEIYGNISKPGTRNIHKDRLSLAESAGAVNEDRKCNEGPSNSSISKASRARGKSKVSCNKSGKSSRTNNRKARSPKR